MTLKSAAFGKRFDENGLRQILTERYAGIAHLADQAGMAADEPDALLFTQSHLPEAVNDVGFSGELLDANHGAGFDV